MIDNREEAQGEGAGAFKMPLLCTEVDFASRNFRSREIKFPDITYTNVLHGNRAFPLLPGSQFSFSFLVNEQDVTISIRLIELKQLLGIP